jgi:hypothetical protein
MDVVNGKYNMQRSWRFGKSDNLLAGLAFALHYQEIRNQIYLFSIFFFFQYLALSPKYRQHHVMIFVCHGYWP